MKVRVISHHPPDAVVGPCHSLRLIDRSSEAAIHVLWHDTHSLRETIDAYLACREERSTVILFNGAFSLLRFGAPVLLAAALFRSFKVSVLWHESAVSLSRVSGRASPSFFQMIHRRLLWPVVVGLVRNRQVNHLAVSEVSANAVADTIRIASSDIKIVYNCVDSLAEVVTPQEFSSEVDELRICSAGVDDERKGREDFGPLLDALMDRGFRPKATWYGDVHLSPAVALDSRVVQPGFVNDLRDHLQNEHIYVALSTDEPFSVAAIEALSVGLPVFVRRGTGLAEVVPSEFTFGSVVELADMLLDRQLRGILLQPTTVTVDLSVEAFAQRLLLYLRSR